MTNSLPFVGAECTICGYLCRDEDIFAQHVCFEPLDVLAVRLKHFVMRWVPRVQQAEAEHELADILKARRD